MNVVFFPRSQYPLEVCVHRLGKRMTYTDQSDQLKFKVSYDWITAIAKQRGIKIGFFAYYAEPTQADFAAKAMPDWDAGHIWIDQYSWTHYTQPKIDGVSVVISEDTFREAYYEEKYGLLPPFLAATGRKPVALSYSYGNDSFKDATCPLYLAGRRSQDLNCSGTDYGAGYGDPNNIPYSMEEYKSKPSSYRWWDRAEELIKRGMDEATAYQTAIDKVAAAIDATMQNGGWFRNFTHFHSMMQAGEVSRHYAEVYYDMLAAKNVDGDIYFAGYGEAVAYLVYRQMVHNAVMYSPVAAPQTLVIQLETRNRLGVDEELLQVPLSVKFSTAGTPLAGKQIKCDCNLISLGNGEYIAEIPFARFPKATVTENTR